MGRLRSTGRIISASAAAPVLVPCKNSIISGLLAFICSLNCFVKAPLGARNFNSLSSNQSFMPDEPNCLSSSYTFIATLLQNRHPLVRLHRPLMSH